MSPQERSLWTGTAALALGACCIALAPVMVKLSPVGPQASAVWRLAFALPALVIWALMERTRSVPAPAAPMPDSAPARAPLWLLGLAGFLFAGDLATWHAGIVRTSAANATFLANLTPVVVVLATWIATRKLPGRLFLAALALALAGSLLLSGGAPGSDPERLLGDALSAATSLWYAAYLLVVARLRGGHGAGLVMAGSTAVALPFAVLVAVLSGESLVPPGGGTPAGWAPLIVLGLVSHVAGQGLLAWALGRVPTALASVLILFQPVVAGGLGWLWLGETLGPLQLVGAGLVLAGVFIARMSQTPGAATGTPPAPRPSGSAA